MREYLNGRSCISEPLTQVIGNDTRRNEKQVGARTQGLQMDIEALRQPSAEPVRVLQGQQVVNHADQTCPTPQGIVYCKPGLDVPGSIEKQQHIAGTGCDGPWFGFLAQCAALQGVGSERWVGKPIPALARHRGDDKILRLAGLFDANGQ